MKTTPKTKDAPKTAKPRRNAKKKWNPKNRRKGTAIDSEYSIRKIVGFLKTL